MSGPDHEDLAKRFNEDEQVDRLVREAVRQAVQLHFSRGERVVVWREGRAVWVDEKDVKAKES